MSGQLVTQNLQLYNAAPSDAEGGRAVSIVMRGRTSATQAVTDLGVITASHATNEPDEHAQLHVRVHAGGASADMVEVATFQTDRVLLHHTTNVPSLSVQGLVVGRDATDGSLVLAAPNTDAAAALAAQPLGTHVGDPLPTLPYQQLQWGTAPYIVQQWGSPATVTVSWPTAFTTDPTVWVTAQPTHAGVLQPWPYTWLGPCGSTSGTMYVGLQPPPGSTAAATDSVPATAAGGLLHWMALV